MLSVLGTYLAILPGLLELYVQPLRSWFCDKLQRSKFFVATFNDWFGECELLC
jgi:hypothetical protein